MVDETTGLSIPKSISGITASGQIISADNEESAGGSPPDGLIMTRNVSNRSSNSNPNSNA